MSEELKPCPFCGNEAEIERYGTRRQSTIYTCTNCGCRLETGEEWGHGDDWNKRPTEAAAEARGMEAAALWHDERSKGPDVFETELHQISAAAIRHIAANPSASPMDALDAAQIRASIGQEHSGECPKCETAGEDCGEPLPTWEELAGYWKGEVERLREALRRIAEGNLGPQKWQANYDKIKEVARAALNGGQHE